MPNIKSISIDFRRNVSSFSLSLYSIIKQAFVDYETMKSVITVTLLLLECLADSSHPI